MSLMETLLNRSKAEPMTGNKRIGLQDIQDKFAHALREGVRQEFPGPLGELLSYAVDSCPRGMLSVQRLESMQEDESAAIMRALVANTVDGSTMRLIMNQVIRCALLNDEEGIKRWGTEAG